jgi:hypothetical protein
VGAVVETKIFRLSPFFANVEDAKPSIAPTGPASEILHCDVPGREFSCCIALEYRLPGVSDGMVSPFAEVVVVGSTVVVVACTDFLAAVEVVRCRRLAPMYEDTATPMATITRSAKLSFDRNFGTLECLRFNLIDHHPNGVLANADVNVAYV